MTNNKKTLRYAFWLGMSPLLIIASMVLLTVVLAYRGESKTPEKPQVIKDTVFVVKTVIEYRDTSPKRSTYVVPKPQPAKPVEPVAPVDTTSN